MLKQPWATTPEQAARKRHRWTYDALQSLPESLDHVEIHDGNLVMSASPHLVRHQTAVGNIYYVLRTFAAAQQLGCVFVAPADVVLGPKRVVQPDVLFVAQARRGILGAAVMGAPDLVVEVLTPSTAEIDRTIKRMFYEEAGVLEYWLVDPETRTVEVLALEPDGYTTFSSGGTGDRVSSRLMDGLVFGVNDLFDEL